MSLIIKEVQTIIGARDSWHIHKLRSILLPVRASEQDKVIGVGVRIYMFVDKKTFLNRALAIDSPFQTFAVGLLVKFID